MSSDADSPLVEWLLEATEQHASPPDLLSNTTAAHILALVESGQLKPGERLPPERELAEKLGMSRTVIREAFRALEATGVVEAHVGRGRFIGAMPSEARSSFFVSRWLETHVAELRDLSQVRQLLEREAVSSLTKEDAYAIAGRCRVTLEKSKAALIVGDMAALADLDAEFHSIPLGYCRNRPLRVLALGLVQGMRPMTDAVIRATDRADFKLDQHERILAAFQNGDVELVTVLVGDHHGSAARRFAEVTAASDESDQPMSEVTHG
jgi:GntR family transcriptional repressor for pyruvate dehydrogenase complex